MAENWSFSWNHSGSTQTRTLTPSSPELADNYRRITRITRRCGQYCYTGGGYNKVGLGCYDELIDSRTGAVILTSTTESCEVAGDAPFGTTSYMTTEFNDIPVAASHLILAAWRAGALQIKRTLWIRYYDSRSHGNPYFRSEYSDKFSFEGTDCAYRPILGFTAAVKTTEERLYALEWAQPPFDFSVITTIESSEYWEDAQSLHRRLEVSAVNLSRSDAPPMENVYVSTASTDSTEWSVTQAQFSFLRSEHGFLRGCRYRIDFTFKVGRSADSLTESATLSVEIDKAQVPFHLSRHGRGVAIGQYSSVVEIDENGDETEDRLFECGYPGRFYDGLTLYGRHHGINEYSASETIVGNWIDGKPIYRSVIDAGAKGSNSQLYDVSALDVETFVSLRGMLYAAANFGDGMVYPIPFVAAAEAYMVVLEAQSRASIRIGSTSRSWSSGFIIIEYTKAGDAAEVAAGNETEE